MTRREKILAGGVAILLLLVGGQLGINRYRSAVDQRLNKINQLTGEIDDLELRQVEAALAERRAGMYALRSLPSDLEEARSNYSDFLASIVAEVDLDGASATPSAVIPKQGLYRQLNFKVTGEGTLAQMIELFHRIHAADYLHRISNFSLREGSGDGLRLDMTVQALALDRAPAEIDPPGDPSPLVAELDDYLQPIMNRNMTAPPNRSPEFAADRRVKATLGEELTYEAIFQDPDEGQEVRYELVGDVPEGLRFDERSGQLRFRPESTGPVEVRIKAIDDGWPRLATEETLVIDVEEPEPEEAPPPDFNEATQTFLTGLTQSRGRWMAMLHIRTQGKTLRLYEGDTFEVGQMNGKVVEINERFATLERDGEPFVLRFDISLADAWENSAP
jgi:hypothetical protein